MPGALQVVMEEFPGCDRALLLRAAFPPGRVHLGWAPSMQWMNSLADAPDHILAGMSASAPVIRAVHEQQAADWRASSRCAGRKCGTVPGFVAYTARAADETG